jgi:hypothetical protein
MFFGSPCGCGCGCEKPKNQNPVGYWTGLDWTGLDWTGVLQYRTLFLTGPGVGFRVLGAFGALLGFCEDEEVGVVVAANPALVLSLISSREEEEEEEKSRNSRDQE